MLKALSAAPADSLFAYANPTRGDVEATCALTIVGCKMVYEGVKLYTQPHAQPILLCTVDDALASAGMRLIMVRWLSLTHATIEELT